MSDAAKESNLPSRGLPGPASFEDQIGRGIAGFATPRLRGGFGAARVAASWLVRSKTASEAGVAAAGDIALNALQMARFGVPTRTLRSHPVPIG